MCLAIPGKIISIENSEEITFKKAKVSFGGIIKEINIWGYIIKGSSINYYFVNQINICKFA